jgi:two-component system cell cycle sensor histidine kinase/response regulator CckA
MFIEQRVLTAQGWRWMAWEDYAIRDEAGSIVEIQAVGHDITARRQAEEKNLELQQQLFQAQKLESIGRLAGGIAHDFNNLLAIMVGMSSLTRDSLPAHSKERENLDEVLVAGQRARELVQQLLTFSRPDHQPRKPVLVQPVVHETIRLLRASLPSDVAIQPTLTVTPVTILANPVQLQQILLNLCLNAKDALAENGGIVTITLSYVARDARSADRATAAGKHRSYAEITVSDNGCGITPDVRPRIFDPFFTTKEEGKGNGMGLALVHAIVTTWGGRVEVDSEPKKGSTFRVYLPLIESTGKDDYTPEPALAEGGMEGTGGGRGDDRNTDYR